MATKTKGTTKAEPKEETHEFSYEFLSMLEDTATNTLHEHFKKTKASEDVAQLFDMVCCIFLEQIYILEGGKQDVPNVADYVTRTVHHIAALGGEWHSPTGTITPLKDVLAMRAKGK